MQRRPRTFVHAAMAVLIVTSLAANEEIADYRHESMEAVGAHFASLRKIVGDEVPFDSHLKMHANALNDYADIMDSLFEEGSEGGEALDKIWEEPEKFAETIETFQEATQALVDVLDKEDATEREIAQAVGGIGRACKGCHDPYRE